MSSLRNSLHRRNHKERSQLASRSRLGLLEKHKDYVLRAKDYHAKQDKIKRLREKAAERNKDEFYFAMVKQSTQGGVHVHDRGNVALPMDMVKVLKTQDENYIRTMRAAGLKKIDRLKAQLSTFADLFASRSPENGDVEEALTTDEVETLRKAGIFNGGQSLGKRRRNADKHIIFVDNEAEALKYKETSTKVADSDINDTGATEEDSIDLGWKSLADQRGKQKQKACQDAGEDLQKLQESREVAKKHRGRLLKELSARLARDTQLRYAVRELEMQRLLTGKGARKKLRGVEEVEGNESEDESEEDVNSPSKKSDSKVDEKTYKPRVYKWRAERKR